MLKLKTTQEFTVPTERGTTNAIVRFIIERLEIDANNVRPIGYYYRLDENGQPVILAKIGNSSMKQWETVEAVEYSMLGVMASNTSLKANLMQRLLEFTELQMDQEGVENYGTVFSDYEIDTE